MTAGILCGLLTASLQAASYFFSRAYLQKYGNAVVLLIASQMMIALVSLAAAPFIVPMAALNWQMVPALFITCSGFMIGQFFFFRALKVIESSRIASLLGLKVVLVPMFLALCFGQHFKAGQWLALLMATAAAMLINYRGGKLFVWKGMLNLLVALPMYAWSDIGISMLVMQLPGENAVHNAVIGALFDNLFVGAVLLPFIWTQHVRRTQFIHAVPYALCWGCGIMLFFICYSYIGPAFGNVVQAVRGPLSLLIGIVLARLGWSYLEEKVGAKIWSFRAAASLLMTAAILIYALAK